MKAVLVIDMPCSCADCRFCQYEDSIKSSFCTADPSHMFKMNEEGGVYSMRRDFCCPLKSLPKKEEKPIKGEYDYTDFCIGYTSGWNECLEALEDSQNGEDSNE